jgi:hypothetical protein
MNNVNTITICRDTYKTQEDFENAIKKAVMVLLDNEYIMTVRYDEPGLGIVCIEFENGDSSAGCDYPYWLSPTEWETVVWDDEVENDG